MPTMPSVNRITSQELLKAVDRLPPAEFEQFLAGLERLRGRRRTDRLDRAQSRLLAIINRGFAESWWRRYQRLTAKRDAEALTDVEHRELLRLTQRAENRETKRVDALLKLARLRNQSLDQLMKDLGIPAQRHE
jgi:hypothetical protein